MALNPNYDQIGKAFTTQYYQLFDNPATRCVTLIDLLLQYIQSKYSIDPPNLGLAK